MSWFFFIDVNKKEREKHWSLKFNQYPANNERWWFDCKASKKNCFFLSFLEIASNFILKLNVNSVINLDIKFHEELMNHVGIIFGASKFNAFH